MKAPEDFQGLMNLAPEQVRLWLSLCQLIKSVKLELTKLSEESDVAVKNYNTAYWELPWLSYFRATDEQNRHYEEQRRIAAQAQGKLSSSQTQLSNLQSESDVTFSRILDKDQDYGENKQQADIWESLYTLGTDAHDTLQYAINKLQRAISAKEEDVMCDIRDAQQPEEERRKLFSNWRNDEVSSLQSSADSYRQSAIYKVSRFCEAAMTKLPDPCRRIQSLLLHVTSDIRRDFDDNVADDPTFGGIVIQRMGRLQGALQALAEPLSVAVMQCQTHKQQYSERSQQLQVALKSKLERLGCR